jgi:hypothetical protein
VAYHSYQLHTKFYQDYMMHVLKIISKSTSKRPSVYENPLVLKEYTTLLTKAAYKTFITHSQKTPTDTAVPVIQTNYAATQTLDLSQWSNGPET